MHVRHDDAMAGVACLAHRPDHFTLPNPGPFLNARSVQMRIPAAKMIAVVEINVESPPSMAGHRHDPSAANRPDRALERGGEIDPSMAAVPAPRRAELPIPLGVTPEAQRDGVHRGDHRPPIDK